MYCLIRDLEIIMSSDKVSLC